MENFDSKVFRGGSRIILDTNYEPEIQKLIENLRDCENEFFNNNKREIPEYFENDENYWEYRLGYLISSILEKFRNSTPIFLERESVTKMFAILSEYIEKEIKEDNVDSMDIISNIIDFLELVLNLEDTSEFVEFMCKQITLRR